MYKHSPQHTVFCTPHYVIFPIGCNSKFHAVQNNSYQYNFIKHFIIFRCLNNKHEVACLNLILSWVYCCLLNSACFIVLSDWNDAWCSRVQKKKINKTWVRKPIVSYDECNETINFRISQQSANLGGHKVRWSDLLRKFLRCCSWVYSWFWRFSIVYCYITDTVHMECQNLYPSANSCDFSSLYGQVFNECASYYRQ